MSPHVFYGGEYAGCNKGTMFPHFSFFTSLCHAALSIAISRRKIASKLGVCATSIQTWKNIYLNGGLKSLISHEKKGKFSVPKSGNFLNKHCRIPEKDTENSRNWCPNVLAGITNKLLESIEEMKNFIMELAISLDNVDVMSICKCSYIWLLYWYKLW